MRRLRNLKMALIWRANSLGLRYEKRKTKTQNQIERWVALNSQRILLLGSSGTIGTQVLNDLSQRVGVQLIAHSSGGASYSQQQSVGKGVKYEHCDFRDLNAVETWASGLVSRHGQIDVLINCAGVLKETQQGLLDLDIETLTTTFNVNLLGPMLVIKHLLPTMKSKKAGKIVNLSSVGTKFGGSQLSPAYTISKRGVEQFTCTLVKAVSGDGITANTIRVGVVDSKIQLDRYRGDSEAYRRRLDLIPQKRAVQPIEISQVVQYLIFEAPAGLHGAVIDVAAGE